MLFSPLNMRQPRKMQPNKRQKKARLSNIMCGLFSLLGLILFWVGFKLTPHKLVPISHTKSKLSAFVRPQPHLLVSHASLSQVDSYVNSTQSLGSMNYQESASCKEYSSCEIHFPFVELEGNRNIDLTNTAQKRTDFAVLTRKGYKGLVTNVHANQDRAFIISPLESGRESSIPMGPDDFMMGLFDGHGPVGHGTSHFAAMELPPLVLRNMQRRKKFIPAKQATDGIKSAMKDSFTNLDENIPFLETSGSTGILITRLGNFLFLASTGDSQAFLVKADVSVDNNGENGAVAIVQSTVPHKPDTPLESARIRASGGQVIPKMSEDTSSRVVIPIQDGADAGMTLALAMSRSLGDPEGKQANVIIADPNVDVIDLYALKQQSGNTNSKFFVVVASDGLLDQIPPLGVAQRMAQSFYQETPPQPLVACQELILQASQQWMPEESMGYRDDISIAVKMIDL